MSEQPPTSSTEDPLALVDALVAEVQALRTRWEHVDALLASMEENGLLNEGARAGDAEADDPARQMALELARSGRTREEVEAYLEQTFGLRAETALLDDVFADQGD
jgi:hypothetical protein